MVLYSHYAEVLETEDKETNDEVEVEVEVEDVDDEEDEMEDENLGEDVDIDEALDLVSEKIITFLTCLIFCLWLIMIHACCVNHTE